ncbi:uncharacterized protein LOC128880180 [Hylaeus volcanicus]|uniref:uncharacterized protein LOC128880180 n=1 Tax=Hylaeus volcanicus TaxID=313075 RepID=UPI0023B82BAD|nr:uncharacterized protein LOC128880180 [Hylaeus volcanicus]
MAPRAKKPPAAIARQRPSSKSATQKEATTKRGRPAPRRLKKIQKSKDKGRTGKVTEKLKGWLQTPADWARFNAWAKINAQPKKIPEHEPIVRPSRPLCQLRKRLKILAQPRKTPDPRINCVLDHSISKAALIFCPSRRLVLLSLPNVRLCDYGRVFYKVSPAALKYEASDRICELSQPRVHLPEECKPPRVRMCEQRRVVDPERLKKLALAKKLLHCPEQLTPEEIAEIFTPHGIKRSALVYEITPWMEYLALPSYKRIKYRKDENALTWKKVIIEDGPERGKSALAEQEKRIGRKRKYKELEEGEEGEEGEEKGGDGDAEPKDDEEKKAKRRKIEKHAWRYAPHPCKDDPYVVKRGVLEGKVPPGLEKLAEPRVHKSKAIRSDPFKVRKGALTASASARVESLAKPINPLSPIERRPPREKDKYGKPIFKMPVYGKVLPKVKEYKMRDCPPEDKEKTKKVAKKRPIDPIAYEPTYDPCIYPGLAKRQKRERKRAERVRTKKQTKQKEIETNKEDEEEK